MAVDEHLQANARDVLDYPEDAAKFVVGRHLRYLGPSDENPARFTVGDVVRVVEGAAWVSTSNA